MRDAAENRFEAESCENAKATSRGVNCYHACRCPKRLHRASLQKWMVDLLRLCAHFPCSAPVEVTQERRLIVASFYAGGVATASRVTFAA